MITNILLRVEKGHDGLSMLSIGHGVVASAQVGLGAGKAPGGWSRFGVDQGAATSFIDGCPNVNDEMNGVEEVR